MLCDGTKHDGGWLGGLTQSSGHPNRSLPPRGWQSWPHVPSSSGWAPQAMPGRGHRAGGRVAAVPEGCPGHLHGVWDLQVGLALDEAAWGPGWTNRGDLTVEAAAPFSSRPWLSRRLDHRAKPGLGFCWELLIGLTGTGQKKTRSPLPLGTPQGSSALLQGAGEKGVSASSWWQLAREQLL